MTDLASKPATGRGLRFALAVSVAVNLAIAGVVGGAVLRADGPRGHPMHRDLGFGFFGEALTPGDRAELRRLMVASRDVLPSRQEMGQDLAAILAALRAEPFDPEALDVAMQSQVEQLRARLDLGQVLMVEFLSDLPDRDRLAFADRLEAAANTRPAKRANRPAP